MTDSQNAYPIQPKIGLVDATIRPPGSKSITNRALLIAALSCGESQLHGVLDSDDTQVMLEALRQLGIEIEHRKDRQEVRVVGCGGQLPRTSAELFCENSGTSIRFLTAALGLAGGQYRLDGIERMRQRPIGPLVFALQQLGANIWTESPQHCPPVAIDSKGLPGGSVEIAGDLSSQYLSGLLMAAPLAAAGLQVSIVGELVSQPYVAMTIAMMRSFGVAVATTESEGSYRQITVAAHQKYRSQNYAIEPDASAASYFWATAAICGGRATVTGLNRNSLQGDVKFVEALAAMGCQVEYHENAITVIGPAKNGIEIDMSQISDTVQTLSVVALFVEGATTITNVAHNRIKETDRISDLTRELRKLGGIVEEFADGLSIQAGNLHGASIDTYRDHRMAMSLALAGLKIPGVVIQDPGCVSKTFPDYFQRLESFLNEDRNSPT